jgi:hypothetical protein
LKDTAGVKSRQDKPEFACLTFSLCIGQFSSRL